MVYHCNHYLENCLIRLDQRILLVWCWSVEGKEAICRISRNDVGSVQIVSSAKAHATLLICTFHDSCITPVPRLRVGWGTWTHTYTHERPQQRRLNFFLCDHVVQANHLLRHVEKHLNHRYYWRNVWLGRRFRPTLSRPRQKCHRNRSPH